MGMRAPYGCLPTYSRSNQRTNSAPPRYGKMRLSRSHRGALPNTFIWSCCPPSAVRRSQKLGRLSIFCSGIRTRIRSEEHTSELQSHVNLVCRLLLEKKKKRSLNVEYKSKKQKKSSKH